MSDLTVDNLVEKYTALRAKRSELKSAYEEKDKRFKEAMAQIEALLMKQMQELEVESFKTPHGTAYQSVTTQANAVDWDLVFGYMRESGDVEMLQKRINKKAALEFAERNDGELPPGVALRQEISINVRKK